MLVKLTEKGTEIPIVIESSHIVYLTRRGENCEINTTSPQRAKLVVAESMGVVISKILYSSEQDLVIETLVQQKDKE